MSRFDIRLAAQNVDRRLRRAATAVAKRSSNRSCDEIYLASFNA